MITIHHLGVSQSDRIVWLMEELGLGEAGFPWQEAVRQSSKPAVQGTRVTARECTGVLPGTPHF